MNLLNIFKSFKNDESGAVTVDWVVLTGAVVGLGLLISQTMGTSITNAANTVGTTMVNNVGGAAAGGDAGGDAPAEE